MDNSLFLKSSLTLQSKKLLSDKLSKSNSKKVLVKIPRLLFNSQSIIRPESENSLNENIQVDDTNKYIKENSNKLMLSKSIKMIQSMPFLINDSEKNSRSARESSDNATNKKIP